MGGNGYEGDREQRPSEVLVGEKLKGVGGGRGQRPSGEHREPVELVAQQPWLVLLLLR